MLFSARVGDLPIATDASPKYRGLLSGIGGCLCSGAGHGRAGRPHLVWMDDCVCMTPCLVLGALAIGTCHIARPSTPCLSPTSLYASLSSHRGYFVPIVCMHFWYSPYIIALHSTVPSVSVSVLDACHVSFCSLMGCCTCNGCVSKVS